VAAPHDTGAYLQDLPATAAPHYADYGPELTRGCRGLRLWLPLWTHGVAAFRDALDEKLDLARFAYHDLRRDPDFDVPLRPDLSVVVFRARGDDDANRRLLARMNDSGRVYLSGTTVHGRYTLRLCVLSHRTHAEHLKEALQALREHAAPSAPEDAGGGRRNGAPARAARIC
jgi:aromatic-L-amino-acid decarboxylase